MIAVNEKTRENIWISIVIALLLFLTLIQAYTADAKNRRDAEILFIKKQKDFIGELKLILQKHEEHGFMNALEFDVREMNTPAISHYFEDISIEIFKDNKRASEDLIYSHRSDRESRENFRHFSEMMNVQNVKHKSGEWVVKFRTLPNFGWEINRLNALYILFIGCGLCVFIFAVLRSFKNAKKRAELISAERTLELMKSEMQFRSAMEYASIGMTLVSPQGAFLKVNKALCKITGYREQELLTMDFQQITHPDDLGIDMAYLQQMIRGEIQTYEMEKRYIHKNGHIIWVLLNVSVVRKESGNVDYFISQIQDITQKTEAMKSLKNANEELEEFSYRTSHDLRSP